jgi:hypothetical protein
VARTAAARALTAPGDLPERRFHVRLASAADDEEIRRLLREHPLPGDVALTFEREPDTAIAAAIEGDQHQTIVACDRDDGGIGGVASRSERNVFLNGRPGRLGYLGQLRTPLRGRSAGTLLGEGFAFCRTLHERGDVAAYLTAVVFDNHAAHRLLCGLRSPDAPRFVRAGGLVTLAIPSARRKRAVPPGLEIRPGSVELLPDIVSCLERNGRRYQFTPRWTIEDLLSARRTPGLGARNFLVAIAGGRVTGCAAIWDQRGFKQVIVRGYSRRLARWRGVVNLAAPWVGMPALPAVGQPLEFVYLSHVAVDNDRPDVIAALVSQARGRLPDGVTHLVTAFADKSPLLAAVTRVARHRTYRSVLYLVCWSDGQPVVESIDARLAHPEVAIL